MQWGVTRQLFPLNDEPGAVVLTEQGEGLMGRSLEIAVFASDTPAGDDPAKRICALTIGLVAGVESAGHQSYTILVGDYQITWVVRGGADLAERIEIHLAVDRFDEDENREPRNDVELFSGNIRFDNRTKRWAIQMLDSEGTFEGECIEIPPFRPDEE